MVSTIIRPNHRHEQITINVHELHFKVIVDLILTVPLCQSCSEKKSDLYELFSQKIVLVLVLTSSAQQKIGFGKIFAERKDRLKYGYTIVR